MCQVLLELSCGGLCPLARVDVQDGGPGLGAGQREHQLPVEPVGTACSLSLLHAGKVTRHLAA